MDPAVDGAQPDLDQLDPGVDLVHRLRVDGLDRQLRDQRADRVVRGGLADPGQIVVGALRGAAGVLDGLADRRVGRGGELVDPVRVERGGDQRRALQGQLEQLALGAVGGAAQVQRGAAGRLGGGRRAASYDRGAAPALLRSAGLVRRAPAPSGRAARPA